jgi:hypothetical protein
MKAIEYLEEQKFGYDHFTKLTSTGINPDNDNIAQFAEDYHQAKLNLLTIPVVSKAKRTVCPDCFDRGELRNDKEEIIGTCPCHY